MLNTIALKKKMFNTTHWNRINQMANYLIVQYKNCGRHQLRWLQRLVLDDDGFSAKAPPELGGAPAGPNSFSGGIPPELCGSPGWSRLTSLRTAPPAGPRRSCGDSGSSRCSTSAATHSPARSWWGCRWPRPLAHLPQPPTTRSPARSRRR